MDELERFKELFSRKLENCRQSQLRFAMCKDVNWEEKTMTAVGMSDDLEYYGVQLGFGYTDIQPAIGSLCLIGILEGKDVLTFLINAEKVEKVEIKVERIVFNDGKNKGIVKAERLAEKLNVLEKDLNALKTAFQSWIVAPNDGGAALKAITSTWSGARVNETLVSDIENDKITH